MPTSAHKPGREEQEARVDHQGHEERHEERQAKHGAEEEDNAEQDTEANVKMSGIEMQVSRTKAKE